MRIVSLRLPQNCQALFRLTPASIFARHPAPRCLTLFEICFCTSEGRRRRKNGIGGFPQLCNLKGLERKITLLNNAPIRTCNISLCMIQCRCAINSIDNIASQCQGWGPPFSLGSRCAINSIDNIASQWLGVGPLCCPRRAWFIRGCFPLWWLFLSGGFCDCLSSFSGQAGLSFGVLL